jgi:hypothetical protein
MLGSHRVEELPELCRFPLAEALSRSIAKKGMFVRGCGRNRLPKANLRGLDGPHAMSEEISGPPSRDFLKRTSCGLATRLFSD